MIGIVGKFRADAKREFVLFSVGCYGV